MEKANSGRKPGLSVFRSRQAGSWCQPLGLSLTEDPGRQGRTRPRDRPLLPMRASGHVATSPGRAAQSRLQKAQGTAALPK